MNKDQMAHEFDTDAYLEHIRLHRNESLLDMAKWGWQSRQAEVDELRANLERADEIATRENNRANKLQEDNTSTTILLGKTIVKKEALEASIEESLKLIKAWSDQSYRDDVEQLIVDIEEALRGEHE